MHLGFFSSTCKLQTFSLLYQFNGSCVSNALGITACFHANFLDKHVMVHLGLSLCCIKRQIYASEVEQQTSEKLG